MGCHSKWGNERARESRRYATTALLKVDVYGQSCDRSATSSSKQINAHGDLLRCGSLVAPLSIARSWKRASIVFLLTCPNWVIYWPH
jgi:hypothetical protein